MKKVITPISNAVINAAFATAKIAAGAASIWGCYQPKEPKNIADKKVRWR